MPAAGPDQLAETLTSDTLRLGYIAESPAVGESQPAVLTSPCSTVSRVRQTPATVVPLTEMENPIPIEGGQQLQQFATMNQLVTGLGLWTGQAGPTGMQQASSASQNPETAMQMPTTYPQGPLYQATTLAGMNLGSSFQPIRTSHEVPSAFAPADPVVAAPQRSMYSPLESDSGATLQPVPDARPNGLSIELTPTGSDAVPVVAQRTDGLGTTLLPTRSTALPVVAQRTDGLGTTLLPTGSTALPIVAQRTDGLGTTLLPTRSTALPVVAQRTDGLGTTLLPTGSTALPVVAQRTDTLGTTLLPTMSTALPIVAQRPDASTVGSRPTSDLGSVEVELMGRTTPMSRAEPEHPRSMQKEEQEETVKDGEFIEEVEDLWPQLMPQGEADGLSEAGDQELGKRKSADEGEVKAKRRKVETSEGAVAAEREEVTETEVWKEPEAEGSKEWKKIREHVESKIGPTLEISLVAMNGLVSAIQSGNRQIVRTEKASDRMEKALTETSCMLGKVVAALNGLKKAVEENTREDRRREDRWFDMQRKREEEREREREAERRREDRRRDAEKKERAEIRKLISSIGEKKDSARREEKKNSGKGEKAVGKEKNFGKEDKKGLEEEDGKENQKKEVRSVLGKAYTENTMRDLSQRI